MTQGQQNGGSPLGSFEAPDFVPFIGWRNNPNAFPWGGRTSSNTNPYQDAPNTGVVRSYTFDIARGTLAPDGVERDMLLVNGEFPGPTIEANWGDTIQVTVVNNIANPEEGTSLHWHGLLQTGTPYEDGVPGITQWPIAPGETFTYSFVADLYGTSWWHGHYSAQYAGGAFGAMIIHGPNVTSSYDVDLGPVLLTDYYHEDYYSIVEKVMGTNLSEVAPYSVNNLINGKGSFNCSLITDGTACTPNAGYSKFSFQSGTSYRLRLINAGAEGLQKFSIDNHQLQVIAYDFVPIVPYETEIITLGIGQRADVIVTANGTSDSAVWMRSTISTCSLSKQPFAQAMIYYEDADTTSLPNTTAWIDNSDPCANDDLSLTVPLYPITPDPNPPTIADVAVNFTVNATGHLVWTINDSAFRVCYNDPVLEYAVAGNLSFPSDLNVYDFGSNSSIRINIENDTPVGHPMHLHGHNMYVLHEGPGTWDGQTIINAQNPTRRDVQMLRPNGHIVLQIDADNPGVWPFHCHIAWHVSGGLYMNILEHPEQLTSMNIPGSVNALKAGWQAYTAEGPIDQIDSGL